MLPGGLNLSREEEDQLDDHGLDADVGGLIDESGNSENSDVGGSQVPQPTL